MRSSAFPSAAQRQEQIDLAHGNLGVRGGQLRPYVGVGPGGLQVREERRPAGLEEAVGLVCCLLRRLFRLGQRIATLQQRGVLGQAGLGFANGVEHYPIEMRQSALGGRFGLTNARPRAVGRYGPAQ